MTENQFSDVIARLYGKAGRKKELALLKAEAEKETACRVYEAYCDGVDEALKEVRAFDLYNSTELVGGAE